MASAFDTLLAIERAGQLNPVQKTELDTLRAQGAQPSDPGVPMPFSFDYAGEAQKAYGDLGAYYDRLLRESRGDMNKVLSRMVEDYDRGMRIRREDYQAAKDQAAQSVYANAKSRGINQTSAYGAPGRGIADMLLQKLSQPIDTNYARANESALIGNTRQTQDITTEEQRKEAALEQERRTNAASLANERGTQAYNKWSATQLV